MLGNQFWVECENLGFHNLWIWSDFWRSRPRLQHVVEGFVIIAYWILNHNILVVSIQPQKSVIFQTNNFYIAKRFNFVLSLIIHEFKFDPRQLRIVDLKVSKKNYKISGTSRKFLGTRETYWAEVKFLRNVMINLAGRGGQWS